MASELVSNGTNGKITSLLPKLCDDGSNWVLYKERIYDVLVGQDFRKHLHGRAKPPVMPTISAAMTDSEKAIALDAYEDRVDEYAKKESAIRAVLLSTVPEKIQQRIVHVRLLGIHRFGRNYV